MGEKWTIHVERSRGWWTGKSTTLCGLTITEVKVSGWFKKVTCPACKSIEKQAKKR